MRIVLGIALIALQSLPLAWASMDELDSPVQDRIQRYEKILAKGGIHAEIREKLAELYFLTSQCDELRILMKHSPASALLCACGGRCPKTSWMSQLAQLKGNLDRGEELKSTRNQKLWRQVQSQPEAHSVVFKALLKNPRLASPKTRADLEKTLESFEIRQ